MLRSLLEKLSRDRVVRRRLPPEHGGHALYVSPEAAMKLWRRDLGANVGLFAFAAGPSGRELAVEADGWRAGLIERSAREAPASYTPVEVRAVAVSDATGTVTFCIAERGRAGNHLESVPGSTQRGGTREVRPIVIDRPVWNTLALPS